MNETFGTVVNILQPMSNEYPKAGGYTFKTFLEDDPRLNEAAKISRRKKSDVARLLLQRALDLFEKDYKVSEKDPPVRIDRPIAQNLTPKAKAANKAAKKENVA